MSWSRDRWRDEDLWLLCEEGLKSMLGLLVSIGFLIFLKVNFARFADPRIMLFQEILYAAHPDLDVFVAGWASDFSIVHRKLVGSMDKYASVIIG